jgi:hypothetical protein
LVFFKEGICTFKVHAFLGLLTNFTMEDREDSDGDYEGQEIIDVDREEADNIIARRSSEATDAGYESARKKFKLWLSVNYPPGHTGDENDDISDHETVLPLDRDKSRISKGVIEFLHTIVELVSSSRLNAVRKDLLFIHVHFSSLDDVDLSAAD